MRLVGAAGVLVVAMTLLLSAAPGAHAPTASVTFALTTGDLVGRVQDIASRSGERTPAPEPTEPLPATSSATPETTPAPEQASPAEPAAPTSAAGPSPEPQPAAQPAGAAPAAAPPADPGAAMSAEIVTLTNAERVAAGLPELSVSTCAQEQATARSALLVAEGRFEHDPLGPILESCRSGTVGENLSLGYSTASAAVAGWMKSTGHRENILRTSFSQIGVACTSGARGWLCAQVFLG